MDKKIIITEDIISKDIHGVIPASPKALQKYEGQEKIHPSMTKEHLYAASEERTEGLYIPQAKLYYTDRKKYGTKDTYPAGFSRMGLNDFRAAFEVMIEEDFECLGKETAKNVSVMLEHLSWRALAFHIDSSPLSLVSDYHSLKKIWVNLMWGRIKELLKNDGLALQTQEGETFRSRAYWGVLLTSGSATALEATYGYGYDFAGCYREYRKDDPVLFWPPKLIPNNKYADPSFCFHYARDEYVANLMKELLQKKSDTNVLILGAGLLSALRFHGFIEALNDAKNNMTVYACDNDLLLDLRLIFKYPELAQHVKYSSSDILTTVKGYLADGKKFDAVVMTGVMSFMLSKADSLVKSVLKLLTPESRFVFDLQYDNWNLERNFWDYNWGGVDSFTKIRLLDESAMGKELDRLTANTKHEVETIVEKNCPMGAMVSLYSS